MQVLTRNSTKIIPVQDNTFFLSSRGSTSLPHLLRQNVNTENMQCLCLSTFIPVKQTPNALTSIEVTGLHFAFEDSLRPRRHHRFTSSVNLVAHKRCTEFPVLSNALDATRIRDNKSLKLKRNYWNRSMRWNQLEDKFFKLSSARKRLSQVSITKPTTGVDKKHAPIHSELQLQETCHCNCIVEKNSASCKAETQVPQTNRREKKLTKIIYIFPQQASSAYQVSIRKEVSAK